VFSKFRAPITFSSISQAWQRDSRSVSALNYGLETFSGLCICTHTHTHTHTHIHTHTLSVSICTHTLSVCFCAHTHTQTLSVHLHTHTLSVLLRTHAHTHSQCPHFNHLSHTHTRPASPSTSLFTQLNSPLLDTTSSRLLEQHTLHKLHTNTLTVQPSDPAHTA